MHGKRQLLLDDFVSKAGCESECELHRKHLSTSIVVNAVTKKGSENATTLVVPESGETESGF